MGAWRQRESHLEQVNAQVNALTLCLPTRSGAGQSGASPKLRVAGTRPPERETSRSRALTLLVHVYMYMHMYMYMCMY